MTPLQRGKLLTELRDSGATAEEEQGALELFEILSPCLKLNSENLFTTGMGNKRVLGLYRTVATVFKEVTK